MAMAFGASAVRAEDAASPLAAEPEPPRVRVVDITLSGLPDEEAANARLGMTLARLSVKQRSDLSEARLQFLLRRIPGEVTKALEPFGWYSPMVDVRREPARDGVRIRVSVDPGEPVRVKTLDADITGEARDDRFVMRELPKLEPDVGERFVHLDYEASKFRVERKLADRGYFEAKRTTARVAVSRAGKTADVLLRWESGPRHAMGEARFAANQFRPGLLPPLVDWTEGEPYHRNKLDRLRARLSQLDYFALVEVVPAEDGKGEDQRVPIDITTTPAKRTAYTAALRFGSDTGVGVRGSMNRRWVNDRGHKWLSDFEWSQRRSGFTTQYRVPSLRRLPGWWGTRIEYLAEDPESALGYERLGVGAGWQGRRDPYTLSGRVVFAEERTKLLRRDRFPDARQTMLYPELSATYRRVEDPLNPDDSLQLTMTPRPRRPTRARWNRWPSRLRCATSPAAIAASAAMAIARLGRASKARCWAACTASWPAPSTSTSSPTNGARRSSSMPAMSSTRGAPSIRRSAWASARAGVRRSAWSASMSHRASTKRPAVARACTSASGWVSDGAAGAHRTPVALGAAGRRRAGRVRRSRRVVAAGQRRWARCRARARDRRAA